MQARENVLPPATERPLGARIVAPAPPAPVTGEGPEGAARALQEAAGAWLAMLAYVADDGLPLERTSQFGPLAERVRPLDPDGAHAVASLGETMAFAARRNWRAPELTLAVERGNSDFQEIVAALMRLSSTPSSAAGSRSPELLAGFMAVAETHGFLNRNRTRLSAPETARVLRLQASELRRLLEKERGEGGWPREPGSRAAAD
jgi:hypothetical protein